jgi:hypothetical protein
MRILLASETASIGSLMRDAGRIGQALAARGHDVCFAMADPEAFTEYVPVGATETVLPTPGLREPPELVLKRRAPSGFDDVMAVAGFANSSQLTALCRTWSKQVDLLRPDAIVGLHSPLLWLTGPCLAPTFAAGDGSFLPPIIGDGFPRMSATTPPLAAEHVMIANANQILGELGAKPIAALSEVIGRCTGLLYGLPWLDPFLQLRQNVSLGMLGDCPPIAKVPAKKRFAAFLDVFSPNIEALLLGIAGVDEVDCELFLSGATAGMSRFLRQQNNIVVHSNFAELAARMGEMSGVIHHGESDIAEHALAAGIPQLALPFMQHQHNIVGNFGWMGCLMNASVSDSIAQSAGMIKHFAKNSSHVVHAQHHARQLRAKGVTHALDTVVELIESLPAAQRKTISASHAAGD